MNRRYSFFLTWVGNKVVMAVTGVLLFGFAVFHQIANLLIFRGPEMINGFAEVLEKTGWMLIAAELGLAGIFILHIVSSVAVSWASWRARPIGYAVKKDIATSYAARTMIYSGPLFLAFLVYHVLMLRFMVTGPGYSTTDIYGDLIAAFRVPAISIVYILSMLLLGYHLYHGVWSMLHTLGIGGDHYPRLRWIMAPAVAALITAGYIAIPLAVWIGVLK